jgi:hypothetical protein
MGDATRNRAIAEAIIRDLPGEPLTAAQVAVTVAARACVAASVDDAQAVAGLLKALHVARGTEPAGRVN